MTVDYTMNQLVGTVNQQASSAALLGQTGYVADIDRTASLGPGGEDTGMPVSVRYVQGSGALTPGDRVKYSSTSWGTVVEAAGAEVANGIVDPNIASATSSGDYFLIFTEGPMKVNCAAAVAAGDSVEGAAGGEVVTASGGYIEGKMLAAGTASGSARAYMSFPQSPVDVTSDASSKWTYRNDFFGAGTFGASASEGDYWVVADTSAAGTPTYVRVDGSATGEAALDFDNTAEVQNVCLYHGDTLSFDIDKIDYFEFRVKMNQAAVNAATSLAFGLIGDRNDAIDSIAQAALFRVVGGDSTTAVVVESDDGTNNNDDVATGETLINAYKTFRIDFSQGTSDVRFYIDGARVASGTTFDMSNYTGSLQPAVQLQKTSDTNTDGVTIDYVDAAGSR